MQARVNHWLPAQERKGHIGDGHHAARPPQLRLWWKRNGASDAEIATLIGDKSPRMGGRYSRHIKRAFDRFKDGTDRFVGKLSNAKD